MSKGMSPFIRRISEIMLACALLAVLGCGSLSPGGTGSETVIGKIAHEDGTPARGTVVTLHPSGFNPVPDLPYTGYGTDTTDSGGRYVITINAPILKWYTLQAVNLLLRTRTIVSDIEFSSSSGTTGIATASLHRTGRIKAILGDGSASGMGYIYIPGTTYFASFQNGVAIIDSVPAETVPHVFYNDNTETGVSRSLAENVVVKPGLTTVITFSGSTKVTKFYLATTPGGANVSGNVYGFPLLIRLSGDNFTFSEARADGSDLRFTKADNTPLSFEIERFDATAQLAEIWVRIDTVFGNDSSHFIAMYWGEPAGAMPLNHAKVFDTTNGFRGVWHLAEETAGTGAKGSYKDATGRSSGDDFISATDRTGIIGNGHAFDGFDDYILVNSPVTNFIKGDLTISLWVNIPDSGGTILSKLDTTLRWNKGETSFYFGDGTDTHVYPGANGTRPSFVGYTNSYTIAGQSVAPGDWHHLAFTWKWHGDSTGTSRYFIDGMEVPLSWDSLFVRINENVNALLWIGHPNNNESFAYFKGLMDELEIADVERSADWIRLCYLNQRKEITFVR